MKHLTRRTAQRCPTTDASLATLLLGSPALADARSVGVENKPPLLIIEPRVKRQSCFDRRHPVDQAGSDEHEPAPPPGSGVDRGELFQRGALLVALPARNGGLVDTDCVGEARLRHVPTSLPDGGAETDLLPGDCCRVVGHALTLRIWGSCIL